MLAPPGKYRSGRRAAIARRQTVFGTRSQPISGRVGFAQPPLYRIYGELLYHHPGLDHWTESRTFLDTGIVASTR
jgi:hypothetical protein